MAFERSKKNFTTKINFDKNLVHTPTPYETAIAQKLNQLPIPDMIDSVWASIEMQLDTPVDATQKPAASKAMGKLSLGIICTALVIALLWLYYHHKNKTKNLIPPSTAPIKVTTPAIDSAVPVINSHEKTILPNHAITKKDTATLNGLPLNRMEFDSGNHQPLSPLKLDAVPLSNKPVLPFTDSAKLPLINKPKGVKGISDTSYRIKGDKKGG